MEQPTNNRVFDGYHRNTGGRTEMSAFRLHKEQVQKLEQYKGNKSALARILFAHFFAGRLPSVDAEFKQLINKQ
jgi:hypothetical protein